MKPVLFIVLAIVAISALAACKNTSGLSKQPVAAFEQIMCLDVNGDDHVNDADASDLSKVPDFNADKKHDDFDAAFLRGVDIALDPNRDKSACTDKSKRSSEYLVAHGRFSSSSVSCDGGKKPVLLVGIGGGSVNLRDESDAAGVRSIVDEVQQKLDDKDIDTIAVIAGPAVGGAPNDGAHSAMETWLTHAVQVYLDHYQCLRVAMVGHSHGAVTADVVSSHLESKYAGRFVVSVTLDRVQTLYTGDTTSRPSEVPVFNVYETRDGRGHGSAVDGANVENWDATEELGPKDGERGGPLEPVNHTNIDNSKSVRNRIADDAMQRAIGATATR